MRAIVSITLITLLCGISSVPINASRLCASRKKNIESLSLKQNSASVPEDISNDHDVGRKIINHYESVHFLSIIIIILKILVNLCSKFK